LIKVFKDDKKEDEKEKYRNTDIFILGPNDNEEGYQYIPGKVHADALEALIGIFYLKNKNLHDCQTLLYAFGILNKPNIFVKT
jgi:23S rRNA maturation mini-RNase III